MKKINLFFIAIVFIVIANSCKKDNNVVTAPPKVTTGVYSLNQGNYGYNNTTLTYYDFSTGLPTTDFYKDANGFGLGDTGSDFIIYGGKMYIVMNASGNVAVTDALSAKFIDTVSFTIGGVNLEPENIIGFGSNVFVSCTNNTVAVIDTTSFAITKFITVGANPAQMAISGTNLYVSNTGAFGTYDSTVSVINLSTLAETSKITVGVNPGYIAADNAGYIYVACTGNYGGVGPQLVKVNTNTNTITKAADTAVGVIRYYNNNLYVTGGYFGVSNVRVLSTTDFSAVKSNFISDGTVVTTPYGLDIDNATGDVYVGDAKDYISAGEVFCFNNNGNQKFSFSTTPTATPIKTALIQQ